MGTKKLIDYMTFDYVEKLNHVVTNDVYEEVTRLTTPARASGTYKSTLAMIYTLNSVVNAAYFRFSTDGGTTWTEIRREPKDITDIVPKTHTFVEVHTEGIKEIIVQARKELSGDELIIFKLDIIFERKI